jgi:hypothetical protein
MAHKSFFEYLLAETYVMQRFDKFFESDQEYRSICGAMGVDCKTLEIPFESVLHAANLLSIFNLGDMMYPKVDFIGRLVIKNIESVKSAREKAKGSVFWSFVIASFFGVVLSFVGFEWPQRAPASISDFILLGLFTIALICCVIFFLTITVSLILSKLMRSALSAIKWDHNTNRVIIAHNFLVGPNFDKLMEQMTYNTLCNYLIGSYNLLAFKGRIVKINKDASKTLDDFGRLLSERGYSKVSIVEPGTTITGGNNVGESTIKVVVPDGAGWTRIDFQFDYFELPKGRMLRGRIKTKCMDYYKRIKRVKMAFF